MAVMAGQENLVDGHGHGWPFVTAAAKAGHDLLVVGALTRSRWDHMRDRFAMPGNRHALATLSPRSTVRRSSAKWALASVACMVRIASSNQSI